MLAVRDKLRHDAVQTNSRTQTMDFVRVNNNFRLRYLRCM